MDATMTTREEVTELLSQAETSLRCAANCIHNRIRPLDDHKRQAKIDKFVAGFALEDARTAMTLLVDTLQLLQGEEGAAEKALGQAAEGPVENAKQGSD